MITFDCTFICPIFDDGKYVQRVKENLEKKIKEAARKFLYAAVAAVPQRSGERDSIYSTGFAAAGFANLRDASGAKRLSFPIVDILEEMAKGHIAENEPNVYKAERAVAGGKHKTATQRAFESAFKSLEENYDRGARAKRTAVHRQLLARRIKVKRNNRTMVIKINPYYYSGSGSKVLRAPSVARRLSTDVQNIFRWVGDDFKFTYAIDINYFVMQDARNIGRSRWAPWGSFKAGIEAFSMFMLTVDKLELFPAIDEFLVRKVYKVNSKGGISITETELKRVTRSTPTTD